MTIIMFVLQTCFSCGNFQWCICIAEIQWIILIYFSGYCRSRIRSKFNFKCNQKQRITIHFALEFTHINDIHLPISALEEIMQVLRYFSLTMLSRKFLRCPFNPYKYASGNITFFLVKSIWVFFLSLFTHSSTYNVINNVENLVIRMWEI
jgi:hypothetical protein